MSLPRAAGGLKIPHADREGGGIQQVSPPKATGRRSMPIVGSQAVQPDLAFSQLQ
jgi:hypothetical protein